MKRPTKQTVICPIHHIPLVRRGGPLSRRRCRICKVRRVSERNMSGICVDCQVKLHLQPGSAKPKNQLACPACLGEKTSKLKADTARANGKLGGPPMTDQYCRICKVRRLKVGNKSGVCRTCQRSHGTPKPLASKTKLPTEPLVS